MTTIIPNFSQNTMEAAVATATEAVAEAVVATAVAEAVAEAVADAATASAPMGSFLKGGPLPQICAFDLDYTLWNRDCDKDVVAPYTFDATSQVVLDRYGRQASAFQDVASALGALVDAGVKIAFLSRNPSADSIRQLLKVCPLHSSDPSKKTLWDALPSEDYFHAYSSNMWGKGKDRHFNNLRRLTGVEFSQMLFFDDLYDNVVAAAAQGTTTIHINRNGVTWAALEAGINGWRNRS